MKTKLLLIPIILFFFTIKSFGQASITNVSPVCTIDFSASMQTSVGSNPASPYNGSGFTPNTIVAGRLNSNAWEIQGWDSVIGNLGFGGSQTVDDFARGSANDAVITPGIYAYTELPASVTNPSLMFQAGAADFAPGYITLKVKNNGTTNITQLSVSYNLFVRNDEGRSSSFNFSHSLDNIVYANVPAVDYITPDVADAFQWVNVGANPSRATTITGLNIAPNAFIYLRWSSNDVSGSGNRDEIGLDDIILTGFYGPPAPEINFFNVGLTVLNGDFTPSVADGTDFGPTPYIGASSHSIGTYIIQNLGGATLNITNITLTGPNAADFFISVYSYPRIVPALSTVNLNIDFDPTAIGIRTAFVNIFSNDSDENPYVFMIQGEGIDPIRDAGLRQNTPGYSNTIVSGSVTTNIANNTLFNPQILGGAGQANQFKILNLGPSGGGISAQLVLTGPSPYITIGGANPSDFTLTVIPTGTTINPGFNRTFEIKFNPTAIGTRTAIISFANNDPDVAQSPYTFLVQGEGISPEIDITGNFQPILTGSTTTSVTNHTYFDNVNFISGAFDRTYKIQNIGTSLMTIGAVTITGVNASDFTVITPPAATLANGAATTFTVRFDPSVLGPKTAFVNIVTNDLNENPFTFKIEAASVDFVPCSTVQEIIATSNFEIVPATPIWNFTTTGPASFTGGNAFGAFGDGGTSLKYITGRSLQNSNSIVNLNMANVDTSGYDNVELNVRLGAYAGFGGDGLDSADRVLVSISTDNGVSWSNELQILGNNNSVWSFAAGVGVANTVYSGLNLPTTFAPALAPFPTINCQTLNGYSTLVVTNLPLVPSLSVRIYSLCGPNEIWAIDNITLIGRKENTSVWNGTSWSNGTPINSTKAIIDGNYNTLIDGNLTTCKCEIKTGRNVTITTNGFFSVQGNFVNKGNVLIQNSGSLVQKNDFGVNNGSVTVQRFSTPMVLYDYSYWSTPVANQTLFNFSPATLFDKYFSFSPTIGNWVNAPSATIMQRGKGYIIRSPQNFNATPTVYNTGQFIGLPNNGFIQTPIEVALSAFNLIGNPYPSAINADLFLANAANIPVVEGTIYLWTHNTPVTANSYTSNDYASYNLVGGVGTGYAAQPGVLGNITIPTGNIASCQGFFIKGKVNGQATFSNSMRLENLNSSFFRTSSPSTISNSSIPVLEKHRLWLNLSNSQGAFKQTLIGYIEGATNNIDTSFDGEILPSQNVISFYSLSDNKTLSIQGRAIPFDQNDIVKIGYKSNIAGDFDISLHDFDGLMNAENIYLEDKDLNIIHDLKLAAYNFSTVIGTFEDRFQIRYTNTTLQNNSFTINNNSVSVAVKENKINIKSVTETIQEVTIFDIVGRKVYENKKIENNNFTINNPTSNNQTLILKIKLTNGEIVNKKIVI